MANAKNWIHVALSMTMLSVTMLSAPAFAKGGGGGSGYYLGLHLTPDNSTQKVEKGSSSLADSESSSNTLTSDVLLGYNFSSVYFGAILESAATTNDSGVNPSVTATGLSLGYFSGPFVFMLHYFVQVDAKTGDTAGSSFGSGSGLGADIGFMVPMTSNFVMGANLAYRSVTYKKYDNGTTEYTDISNAITLLEPRLTFGFIF